MDFLLEYGITKDTIKKIKENNEESTCFFCMIHEENVKEVIEYLLSIQIEVIDNLPVSYTHLTLPTT